MTDPDLKPCPFCGGDKNTICKTDYDGRDSYAVSCRYPECHGAIFTLGYGYFADKAEAIAAWNTRAVDPAADRIEQLVKERDEAERNETLCSNMAVNYLERAEVAESKLAKAVVTLREMLEDSEYWWPYARATLAELEKTE